MEKRQYGIQKEAVGRQKRAFRPKPDGALVTHKTLSRNQAGRYVKYFNIKTLRLNDLLGFKRRPFSSQKLTFYFIKAYLLSCGSLPFRLCGYKVVWKPCKFFKLYFSVVDESCYCPAARCSQVDSEKTFRLVHVVSMFLCIKLAGYKDIDFFANTCRII